MKTLASFAFAVALLALSGAAVAGTVPCAQAVPQAKTSYDDARIHMMQRDRDTVEWNLHMAEDSCKAGNDRAAQDYLGVVRSQLMGPAAPSAAPAASGCAKAVPEATKTFEAEQVHMMPNNRDTVAWNLHMAEDACKAGNEKGAQDYLKVVLSQLQTR